MTRGSDWSQPPQDQTGFHFSLGARLGETVSELRTLNQQIYYLPDRMALALAAHMKTDAPKTSIFAMLKPLTQLLQSGLPYVHLLKRTAIAMILLAIAVIGNYHPELALKLGEKVIGLILYG